MSANEDLAFEGPVALAQRVRAGEVSPRELVELFLRRIETLDPRLNAFRVTMAEEAIAAAEAMTKPDGPLAGVPVAIKDCMQVAGQSMTWGSRTYHPPERTDSEAVRRLRAAGAIPIGITNVPELMIFPWTATEANGITRNPWNVQRTPGGSSGGSAAAVAAGMAAAATATDGGGSIRIPAACCGLVGMKPTRGRVSTQPDPQGWLGLSVIGALARTVRDSALLLDVMHGATPRDVDRAPEPGGTFLDAAAREPGRLRVAVSRKIPPGLIARVSPDQRLAFERTARLLGELGHETVEKHPAYGMVGMHFVRTWTRGVLEDSRQVPDPSALERSTRQMARAGSVLVPERRRAGLMARRAGHTARLLALWDEVDVLLTPALASTAIGAEGGFGKGALLAFNTAAGFTPFTSPFNVTGQPAITLPAGLGSDGMPLSVQLVGRPGGEEQLYSLAAQLEAAEPWEGLRPPIS